jgi:hypothetical protein
VIVQAVIAVTASQMAAQTIRARVEDCSRGIRLESIWRAAGDQFLS